MGVPVGLDGATPRASHASQLPLLAVGGAVFAIVLVAVGSASARNAILVLGMVTGLVGFGAIVRFAPETACDWLLLLLAATVAIPIDGHLAYREHVGGWPGLRIALADVATYLLFALVLLGALLGRVENVIPRRILVLMAAVLLWYGISALGSQSRALSLFEIAGTAHSFLLAWIVASLFRRDLLGAIVAMIALSVMVHGGFAIAQGVTGRPIGAGWFGATNELEALSLGREQLVRPGGLFMHPIVFATFLVITLPLLAARLATQRGSFARCWLLAALAIGAVGLLLSLSRGAWISAVIATATLGVLALRSGLLSPRQVRSIVFGGAAIALVLGAAFAPRIYDRFVKSDPSALSSRFDMNTIAFRMIADHPILGTGINNYILNLPHYDTKGLMKDFLGPVHNLYFLEAAEVGIPGLLLLVALFGSFVAVGLRHLPRMQDPSLRWMAAALVAGLVGLLVTQVADFSARLEPLRSMIWFEIGLLFGVVRADRAQRAIARDPGAA